MKMKLKDKFIKYIHSSLGFKWLTSHLYIVICLIRTFYPKYDLSFIQQTFIKLGSLKIKRERLQPEYKLHEHMILFCFTHLYL